MGGSAFSTGLKPLLTPRMPPAVYLAQRARCQALLRTLYHHVDTPIDGPAKKDFGDIDILVFGRRDDAGPEPEATAHTRKATEVMREVATLLGAERSIVVESGGASSNMAIPWPKVDATDTEADPAAKDVDENGRQKYIQVDVRVSPSLESHRWMLFKHAHGDIWNLVGSLVRPYGLTVDDTGMWARIPEVEAIYKQRAKVHLTSSPPAVLSFLDLPTTGAHARRWVDEPFPSQDDMFEYVTHCRMMYIAPAAAGAPDQQNHDEGHNLLKDVQNLKHNDRKRMQHRPGFRRWIEEFIPKCRAQGRFTTQTTDRQQITSEALETFNAREEFERKRAEFLLERQRDYIWNGIIKTQIPDVPLGEADQKVIMARSGLVKGLKRVILERDESYGVPFEEDLLGKDGFYDEEKVKEFIERHKETVQKGAIAKQNATYIETLERKKKAKEAKAKAETGKDAEVAQPEAEAANVED